VLYNLNVKAELFSLSVPEIQYRFSMCDEVDAGGVCDVCEPVHHKPYEFMSIPNSTLAEQLTYIDAVSTKHFRYYTCANGGTQ
jgi:hypothetical protein